MMNGMNRTVQDLVGTVFMFSDHFSDFHHRERVEFHRTNSPFYAGEKWCVRLRGDCLNQEAEWEWEPSPSNRDDEFYARCRFNTQASAVAAYNRNASLSIPGGEPGYAPGDCSASLFLCERLMAAIDGAYDCVQAHGANGLSSIDNLRRVVRDLKSSLQNSVLRSAGNKT